jgi:cobalt/nickel transport system permease protein
LVSFFPERIPESLKIFPKPSKPSGFIEKTIIEIVIFFKESIYNEEIAALNGFLQKCDPRAKLITVILLLISSLLSKSPLQLAVIYTFILFASLFSSVSLKFYLKRVLIIPLFSLIIVIPALFSFVTPGKSLMIFHVFSCSFSITQQGISTGLIFFMRVLTSVSTIILLILTTRSHVLLKVLRIFGVPHLFVMIFGMTFRYIILLLDIIHKTYVAVKSRTGYVKSLQNGNYIAGVTIAGIWLKSYQLQNQVYDAMLSRGFTGEPVVDFNFRIKSIDILIVIISISILTGTIWLNQYLN